MEASHSGLLHYLGKVAGFDLRGFKSHRLRQIDTDKIF